MKAKTKAAVSFLGTLILLLFLFNLILPEVTQAADDNTFKTLKSGKTVQCSGELLASDYYKITVKKAGILDFTIAASDQHRNIKIYDNKADALNRRTFGLEGSYKDLSAMYGDAVKRAVAVDKGTYYLVIGSKVKIKYMFKKAVNKANYCRGKAISLKAGKKITIAQSPKRNYQRWYKIKTTKKHQITFWTNTADNARYRISIYNAKGKLLELVNAGMDTKYCTKDRQPKGTYYICVSSTPVNSYSWDYNIGNVITLKWK